MGTVDLSSFLPEMVRDWEKKLTRKKLNIIVDVPTELFPIWADRTRLQEALYNLLDNAVKYSREHGEIRLSVRQRDGEIELTVSDDGIGIAKEDLPRIFERFYRADKARSPDKVSGTGLGLPIVKKDFPLIFERFYRADKAPNPEKGSGTSLGLGILKPIRQLHGGRVEAD